MSNMENPYQTPHSNVEIALAEQHRFDLAGKGRSFLNLLIDYVGFIGLGMLLIIGGTLIFGEDFAHDVENLPDFLLGASFIMIYYIPLEMLFGRTLGKLITGTRVVTVQNESPTFKHIVIRSLSRMVRFEPFSVLFGNEGGWHDRWSGTKVVRVKKNF